MKAPDDGAELTVTDGGALCSPVASVEVSYPLDYVYEHSNALIDYLESTTEDTALACFAMALTIGRILSPKEMTPQEEQRFVKDLLAFSGAALATGEAN